jgi:hypothetical protein
MSGEKPMKARDIAMAARSLGTRVQRRPEKPFRVGRLDARDELARVLREADQWKPRRSAGELQ